MPTERPRKKAAPPRRNPTSTCKRNDHHSQLLFGWEAEFLLVEKTLRAAAAFCGAAAMQRRLAIRSAFMVEKEGLWFAATRLFRLNFENGEREGRRGSTQETNRSVWHSPVDWLVPTMTISFSVRKDDVITYNHCDPNHVTWAAAGQPSKARTI